MIKNAPDPDATDGQVGAVGQDSGVLKGNAPLIVETVGHPELDLLAVQLARVHIQVEGMLMMVALGLCL